MKVTEENIFVQKLFLFMSCIPGIWRLKNTTNQKAGENIFRKMKLMHIPFIYLFHISSNHSFEIDLYFLTHVYVSQNITRRLRLEKHLTVVKDETDSK